MSLNGPYSRYSWRNSWRFYSILQNNVYIPLDSPQEKFEKEHQAVKEIFKELGEDNQKYYECLWM